MEIGPSQNQDTDLNAEEIELVMKALGYYQIHIFDELSKATSNKSELETLSKRVTASIKKLHKLHERVTGIKHGQKP